MKNNIIFLYISYMVVVCLLFLIDTTILMYYIFWVNNVFINPLWWLFIKIIYYNRTVLLLLLFYYFIAKYTIKELGYKYFFFFNIDIRKWRRIHLNYILNITTYHIEIVSICLFFFVIIMPLFLQNKEIFFFMCCVLILFFIWWRIFKNRFKYIKGKKIRIRSLCFFLFLIIIIFKIFNYQYIKDLYTMYIYLDKWAFELLEWKIKMYSKVVERDIYDHMIGLKPIWMGDKFNKKEISDNKLWDYLLKKKFSLIKELKYKLKRTKKKYYLYLKYSERVFNFKNAQSFDKINKLRKEFILKTHIEYENRNNIKIKEYAPIINTKKENPVITKEKEKERALHRTVLIDVIHKFSINNYYSLNSLLKKLTLNQLYYHSFIDKKGIQKQLMEEKRSTIFAYSKEHIYPKNDLQFLKNIVNKIKKNITILNSMKIITDNTTTSYYYKNKVFFEKLLNYLIIEKKIKTISNYILKKINIKDIKFNKKKEKLSVIKIYKNVMNNINFKEKVNKLSFFNESRSNILNSDKIEILKRNSFCSSPKYIERTELEKMDNKLLYNTVKKYNDGKKTKAIWKNEFVESFILKEKKESLTISDSPDLSRRSKK